ncbi:MAG TPA: alpha/beta hydrolase-fold protein [Saprospiraceae bacterium]|nr:alpha/beta hydrolase-fold protein [Saprospiraceae bacterium]HMP24543.1 alpha/beta hydrolase-fold protein [Saprospiraceae bacterium]
MRLLQKALSRPKRLFNSVTFRSKSGLEIQRLENFASQALAREVRLDVFLPPGYFKETNSYPVLLLNDGQDMEAIRLADTLEALYFRQKIQKIIVIAIHANHERMNEYGVANHPDYKKRGAKAGLFTQFVLQELVPFLQQRYRCAAAPQHWAYAGFSLGGLSAFDIVWHHPQYFSKVGVFSGSFWWRSQAFTPADPDAHRIMLEVLQKSTPRPGLQFWFQTGTDDEKEDRNHNGVIDAIDDTLDVIRALQKLGYHEGSDIQYLEVKGGQHNLPTWAKVMPVFLQWAFANRSK